MSKLGSGSTTVASARRLFACIAALTIVGSIASCNRRENETAESGGEIATTGQRTFASPQAAGAALIAAAKSGDPNGLLAIFGPDSKSLISSGDTVQDRNVLRGFVDQYTQMNRWSKNTAGDEILIIGASNFPFPIPLTRSASGQWTFNTAAGRNEVLARRVGNGELTAIGVLSEVANAQESYFDRFHRFAQQFISDSGQQNGLFWQAAAGQPQSPLAPLAAVAESLGYSGSHPAQPQPFNGYFYRILTAQGDAAKGGAKDYVVDGNMTGGFAILAWPARYMDSGIMSFMVARDGAIYERDLGRWTTDSVAAITAFNPSTPWRVVLAPERSGTSNGPTASRKQALQNANVRPSTGP